MNWKNILKGARPDYPDLDGDGDTEEPMVDALETVEQVESAKKNDVTKNQIMIHYLVFLSSFFTVSLTLPFTVYLCFITE